MYEYLNLALLVPSGGHLALTDAFADLQELRNTYFIWQLSFASSQLHVRTGGL
jgi:hypothetical protein